MRLLILLLAAAGGFLLARHYYRKWGLRPYHAAIAVAVIILIILTLTGKAHWVFAAAAAGGAALGKLALLAMRFFPLFRLAQRAYAGTRTHITMRSRWIEITVERATGAITGKVRAGPLRSRTLESLTASELQALQQSCAADPRSAALLQTYLQHARPAWASEGGPGKFEEGPMSAETAYKILGVEPDADEDAIRTAYRKLAQKVHPDRGGSDYLARKINEARDVLLARRK